MAQCENKIFKNIESQCGNRTTAGIEQTVYLFNRDELGVWATAKDESASVESNNYNKITSIAMADNNKIGFTAKGFKKNLSAGFSRNVSDDTVDTFSQTLTLTGYEFDSASARNFDNMGNIVAVIARKGGKQGDGSILVFGFENGLYVSEDSWASGDNNGARTITLSSLADAGESCSYYVLEINPGGTPAPTDEEIYVNTIAELESLLTPRNA